MSYYELLQNQLRSLGFRNYAEEMDWIIESPDQFKLGFIRCLKVALSVQIDNSESLERSITRAESELGG